jgi:hypothetical protein
MSAIAVDWSGAKRCSGKIWIARVSDRQVHRLQPVKSREEAIDWLLRCLQENPQTVVGLDFAFSFPVWFLRERSFKDAFELWDTAARDGEKWLQECQPPFWGRPGKPRPLIEGHYRRTELSLSSVTGIRPKSVFQIGGAGAVGTGSIRGMPFLSRMRREGCAIWPFDDPRDPLVIEIYPRILTGPVVKSSRKDRSAYLKRWPALTTDIRSRAAASEDAFDALVSALVMDAHIAEIRSLGAGDDLSRLEGEIWLPKEPGVS